MVRNEYEYNMFIEKDAGWNHYFTLQQGFEGEESPSNRFAELTLDEALGLVQG